MRILASGGSLFIGHAIVQQLVNDGHDVTVLHRRDHYSAAQPGQRTTALSKRAVHNRQHRQFKTRGLEHDPGPTIQNLQADRSDLLRVSFQVREGGCEVVLEERPLATSR